MDLIVVYGPPLVGKTTLAHALAARLPGKAAVVGIDGLRRAIARPGDDAAAELDFVHGQVKLLVATYLKNRYSVVVEGPYVYDAGGHTLNYEGEIDKLLELMRLIARRTAIVELRCGAAAVLAERARRDGRPPEEVTRLAHAYLRKTGAGFLSFETGALAVEEIAARVLEALDR